MLMKRSSCECWVGDITLSHVVQSPCQNQGGLTGRALRRRFIDSEAVVDGDSIKPRARGPGWAAIFVSSCRRQRQTLIQTLCRPHTRAWRIIREVTLRSRMGLYSVIHFAD